MNVKSIFLSVGAGLIGGLIGSLLFWMSYGGPVTGRPEPEGERRRGRETRLRELIDCSGDIAKYCATVGSRKEEVLNCLIENRAKLSATCAESEPLKNSRR